MIMLEIIEWMTINSLQNKTFLGFFFLKKGNECDVINVCILILVRILVEHTAYSFNMKYSPTRMMLIIIWIFSLVFHVYLCSRLNWLLLGWIGWIGWIVPCYNPIILLFFIQVIFCLGSEITVVMASAHAIVSKD